MRKVLFFITLTAVISGLLSSCSRYETVPGDPLKAKICTLDNGLKIYMSVDKTEPRLQTMICVRCGGKNDPDDNTGLAHYFEHIMFKGSENLGTSDYAAEKPLLDEIERLFDVYKATSDPAERAAIYHRIDSVSYEASKISIPNEYDKAMAVIGAQGTNAFTGNDMTCYLENIPSNRIDAWAKVQADRFRAQVIRGFHTELETIYEEYNMYLNEDGQNAMQAADSVLFRKHPYGRCDVIGTSEHLKNPSISAIKKTRATYYVPNNMAICASGDFDPDEFVRTIKKYFGDWKRGKDVPELSYEPEEKLTAPVEKTVYGTEAEFVTVSWRTPGTRQIEENAVGNIAGSILYNGMAGLMDISINQQQKALMAGSFNYGRTDYGELVCQGYAKQGQSLEEVRDLILASVKDLREGNFDESLVSSSIANYKLKFMKALERNSSRAMLFSNSFIAGNKWADEVRGFKSISGITKDDIVAWAKEYLPEDGYVTVFKRLGPNPKNEKVEAPKITPIFMNRDKQSEFLSALQAEKVKPIEPLFYDYSRDLSTFEARKGIKVVSRKNETNDIATLTFRFECGKTADPALGLAFDYISYLGTPTRSAAQIASEMYALACNYTFSAGDAVSSYGVTGLDENIGKALTIVEDLIENAVPDEAVLAQLKADTFKARSDAKFNQQACSSALRKYQIYGPEYVRATTMSDAQIAAVTSEELLAKVSALLGKEHKAIYYGPSKEAAIKDLVCNAHHCADELEPLERMRPAMRRTDTPSVTIAPYDTRQFSYIQLSNRGETFSAADEAGLRIFNEYFGGGMNSVVFQEMREARALAYGAYAYLAPPSYKEDNYCFFAVIDSQNDKLQQAVETFDSIIEDMPKSDAAFAVAKTALEGQLRTRRYNGASLINKYLSDQELGLDEPMDKAIFDALQGFTMEDLAKVHEKWVKGRTYSYSILGDPKGLDQKYLGTLGPVKNVSLEEVFGY